jgi:hypothetical protein
MTPDRTQAELDGAPFDPEDHDVRLERDGWIYYVRAVRRTESLAGRGLDPNGSLIGLAVLLALEAVFGRFRERLRWKVGVVRLPSPRSWNADRPRVLHRELLGSGEYPGIRIAALAADVEAGAFRS